MENEDEVIKAIKEEYEKKLEEQKKQLEEEKDKAIKDLEEKHIKQIRSLLSGEKITNDNDKKTEEVEKTFEEKLYENLRAKNKLNKEV
ncbi:hypothetical protein [Clostridium sp.]|uniref:hypothetical protein n=1 Tax=Clostridium sp. TaxID=1506 RepID=UPI0025BE481A|nr:hypothetical protein [Clostridium sp.]